MKYYITIKENQISPFVKTWMHLEEIIQNEVDRMNKYLDELCKEHLTLDKIAYTIHKNNINDITNIIKEINPEMDEITLNEYSFIIRNLVIIISRSLIQLDLDDVTDIDILTTYVTAHKYAENRCKRISKIFKILKKGWKKHESSSSD